MLIPILVAWILVADFEGSLEVLQCKIPIFRSRPFGVCGIKCTLEQFSDCLRKPIDAQVRRRANRRAASGSVGVISVFDAGFKGQLVQFFAGSSKRVATENEGLEN